MKPYALLLPGLIIGGLAFAASVSAQTLPTGFKQTLLKDQLDAVSCQVMPDGRVLLVEKRGVIQVFDKEGKMLPEPLLDYEANTNSTYEKGMMAVMPHPDFASNGIIFVQYTNKREFAGRGRDQVSTFKVTGNKADPASELLFFNSGDAGANYHHGGGMRVGPDGKMYIACGNRNNAGKGGSSDKNAILGKIHRVNLDGSIPTDNPFYAENTGDARAVWSYGHRNPFTFAFLGTRLFLNDVMDDKGDDELNEIIKGTDYGYDGRAGKGPEYTGGGVPGFTEKAMVGAEFYTGTQFPEHWKGRMFFGGIGRGDRTVQTYNPAASGDARFEIFTRLGGTGNSEECPVDYKMDLVGSLYIVTRCETVGWNDGKLIKITYGDPPPWPTTEALENERLLKSSLRWSVGRGVVDVDLLRDAGGATQRIEIRALDGTLVASAGAGPTSKSLSLSTMNAKGVHVLIWRAGSRTSAVKVLL
jgi:glucose/arabinose dehydrogenase